MEIFARVSYRKGVLKGNNMKTKQLLLLLPAMALLAACGGEGDGAVDSLTRGYKEIEPAQALTRAQAIDEKVSASDYTLPTKATYHSIIRATDSLNETTQIEMKAVFDFDENNPYFYCNVVSAGAEISYWTYVDNGKCYLAADDGTNKIYSVMNGGSASESGEAMFENADFSIESIISSSKEMAQTIAYFATQVQAGITLPEGSSLDYTFKANGEGDLSLEATEKASMGESSSDIYIGVVFKDYLLVYAETDIKATADGKSSHQYGLVEIDWDNAVHTLPDLSQFSSHAIDVKQ